MYHFGEIEKYKFYRGSRCSLVVLSCISVGCIFWGSYCIRQITQYWFFSSCYFFGFYFQSSCNVL